MKIFKILFIFFLPIALFCADYDAEVLAIKDKFDKSLSEYKAGNNDVARQLVQEAYFGHFENLEAGIRINLGQKKAYAMEKKFGDIRKAIKSEKPLDEVTNLIHNLLGEIDEILPVIKEGKRLVAEKQHSAPDVSAPSNDANPWNNLYLQIVSELNNAKIAYEKGDKTKIISILNKVKFDIYRNQKLEIAIRQYSGQSMDAMIQQILSNAISKNITLSAESFQTHLKDVDDLVRTAIAKLPESSYKLAPENLLPSEDEDVSVDFTQVSTNIRSKMAEVLELYKNGEIKQAVSLAQDIYFDEYEASGMELKVGTMDNTLKLETEASFSAIASLIQSRASIDKIIAAQNELFAQLDISAQKASKSSSPMNLFILALTIILREGLEALIIVAAVVAYLIKTGNSNKLSIVYSSFSVAVVLSFFTAWVVNLLFTNAAQSREILEGATMLIAVVLLFYVGFWLLSNAGSKKWNKYIQGKISQSLSKGDKTALWWVTFLAVYREGAETVLFYQALIFDAQRIGAINMIIYGFLVGCVILAILFIIFKMFSVKIPLRAFFLITSAIIFYMAIVFTGKGVMELVEGKVFVPTIIPQMPTITWLGIYPYLQSLIPQILMLLALIVGVWIMKKRENQS